MRKPVVILIRSVTLLALSGLGIANDAAAQQPESRSQKEQRFEVNGRSYPVDVEIAAGARGDDSLLQGVYLFWLKCSADMSCVLQRITLNECTTAREGASAFVPWVDEWSTSTPRQLVVRQIGNDQIEVTVYQAYGKKLPATMLLTFASGKPRPFKEVVALKTNGFIDRRAWPKIDRLIDYVPVETDRTKVLDCPVSLRGLRP